MAKSIDKTLKERGGNYGDATNQFTLAQALKEVMRGNLAEEGREAEAEAIEQAWAELPPLARESLDMLATKVSRIVAGGADYTDNWHDIAGYATLTEKKIGNQ